MTRHLQPVQVLAARISARAALWKAGQFDSLEDMMRPLYAYAQKNDLLEMLDGVDGIDRLMLQALTERPRGEANG